MSLILRVYLKMKWSKLTKESIQIEVKKYLRYYATS